MTCFVNTHKIEGENLSEWDTASYEYTSVANRQDLVCHMPVVAHVHMCAHTHMGSRALLLRELENVSHLKPKSINSHLDEKLIVRLYYDIH